MNDEQDPSLDPEQEERVRALLADLGTAPDTVTTPPEVVARLDETLAGLVAERAETSEPSTPAPSNVVPLRRRWAPRAAAAAAAVIVVGVGGVAVANLGLFGGATSTSDKASSGTAGGRAESLDRSATGTPAPSQPGGLPQGLAARLPHLSAASFDSDVAGLLARSRTQQGATNERQSQDSSSGNPSAIACPGPKVGDGSTTTPVLYDGTPATLVIHPEHGGRQLVEAWTCTGDQLLDSTHVAASHGTAGQSSPGNPGLGSPSPSP